MNGIEIPKFTEDYRYIPKSVVTETLESLGYDDPQMRWVDSIYIRSDNTTGVGVLKVTEERCKGHLGGVLRGVDQGEALGQTFLLFKQFTGNLPEGMKPLLRRIELDFDNIAVPVVHLNLVVRQLSNQGNDFSGQGMVFCGTTILIRGIVIGQMVPSDFLEKLIQRRRRIQAKTDPIFPAGL